MKAYVMTLPLGISRAREVNDIEGLRQVLGDFGFIDFNVSRTSETAYSIQISRTRIPEARGGVMDVEETVGGLVDDLLRLTVGHHVEFLGSDGGSSIKVRFTNNKK